MTDSSSSNKPSTSASKDEDDVGQLFSHWVKRKSGSKAPGQHYYFNTKTKASVWSLEELVMEEKLLEKEKHRIIECLQKKNIQTKVDKVHKGGISKTPNPKKPHQSSSKKKKSASTIATKSITTNDDNLHTSPRKRKTSIEEEGTSYKRGSHSKRPAKHISKAPPIQVDTSSSNTEKEEAKKEEFERIESTTIFGASFLNTPESEVESMEVDEVDPGILEELQNLRSHAKEPSSLSEKFIIPSSPDNDSTNSIVVIDTNIFISHLSSIQNILESGHCVRVPWTVFRELDALKDSKRSVSDGPGGGSEKMSFKARRAIEFLHEALNSDESKLSGQSGEEEREASILFRPSCPDDRIIQCLLFLLKSHHEPSKLLLYSNDKNLLNKALLNKIRVASSSSLTSALRQRKFLLRNEKEGNKDEEMGPQETIQSQTPYDLKKDIIDEAKDLTHQLLTNSLRSELVHRHGPYSWQKKGLLKAPSSEDISSWPLMAAFYQVFAQWETLYAPLLGDPGETSALKKELSIVESLLARPRPLNKVWNLIEECLRSLNLFNAALNASSSSYWETSGRSVRIRIESLLKRKSGVETGGSPLDTEGNIYESFNSIWNYVYAYATSYSISAAVPLNNSIPSPKRSAFAFNEMNSQEICHLNILTNESKKLASKLSEFLGVSGQKLSTSSPLLLDLIHHMQEFLVYCSSFRPGGHPSADPLPKLVPRRLLEYSTQPESRERMMNGLHQLRNLIAQLEVVCAKF